jgi:hypothetical protein
MIEIKTERATTVVIRADHRQHGEAELNMVWTSFKYSVAFADRDVPFWTGEIWSRLRQGCGEPRRSGEAAKLGQGRPR